MPTTVKSLEERVDDIEVRIGAIQADLHALAVDFASFKAKADVTVRLAQWIAATAAVTLISVIFAAVTVARSAGSLESTVQQQQKALDEIRVDLRELRNKPKT